MRGDVSVKKRMAWYLVILSGLIVFIAFTSGCATKGEFTLTEKGFKVKGSPFSDIKAKHGDMELQVDSKFEPFKEIVNIQKL